MSFDFYFFIFRLSNVLSVNTKSLFELSSGLSDIFLIATAADNYIYKVGSFAIEIKFQNKRLVPILKFKEFSLYNIIPFSTIIFGYFWVFKIVFSSLSFIYLTFLFLTFPKENASYKCLSLIMLDSVIKANKKYYPQTLLEECKY